MSHKYNPGKNWVGSGGANDEVIGLFKNMSVSSSAITSIRLFSGKSTSQLGLIGFTTGSLTDPYNNWAIAATSPAYLGDAAPQYENSIGIAQYRTQAGALINGATGVTRFTINDSGSVGIGLSNYVVGNNEQLSVVGNDSNTQAVYVSGSAAATSHGIHIRVGPTSPSAGEAIYLSFSDRAGTAAGGIKNGSTAVNPELFNGSDVRIKQDVSPTKIKGLAMINDLEMIQYKWDPLYCDKPSLNRIGFSAQNCEKVYPEMVGDMKSDKYDFRVKTVAKGELIPILVKAVQELSSEVETFKKKIDDS